MCGIAGVMTVGGAIPSSPMLDALIAAMAHRGPDGSGRHVVNGTALVQTRLAIIDLTTGDQPLVADDGTALVANGEIYNDLDLRAEWGEFQFTTGSDCEPPLHLYRRLGLAFADRLRGMYAIAIHDRAAARLILCRDPFGIKPLYYAETPLGLVFASEPQALLAAGLVSRAPNLRSIGEMLQLQFTTGTECPVAGIHRVLPGETLVVEKGRITERLRRDALPAGPPLPLDMETALSALDTVLRDSIDVHRRADVPYGMFLSGGIDSSVVLAMMARQSDQPVLAFTAAFPGTAAHDERIAARAIAAATGAHHIEVEFTERDFWTLLPAIAAAMDDPVADYATLPTFKLAAEARKSVKVILSGEGGDELFAGYGRYRSAIRPWPLARQMRRRGTFDDLGVLRDSVTVGWRDGIRCSEQEQALGGRSRLQCVQAVDCADWLPNDLLTKLDRCLMAHGIEGRVPFLDPVVAEFAFRLPDRLKIHKSMGKWLLRQWLARNLPAAQPFAPKRGFTVPVGEWIASAGRRLGPLVARAPGIAELCHPEAVVRLFASANQGRSGFAAWTLLYYALWYRSHMLGMTETGGDVFETLAMQRHQGEVGLAGGSKIQPPRFG